MARKKKKKKVKERSTGGERLIVSNSKHVYRIWGKGPADEEGNLTNKLLAKLEFGENLVGQKEWAELSLKTDVKKALKRGTMIDKGAAPKGYEIKVDDEDEEEEEETDEDEDDGGEGSD